MLTFVLGAALAGVAGVLYGMLFRQIFFLSGALPGLKAFTAAVFGRHRQHHERMLGGFLLGEIESVGPRTCSCRAWASIGHRCMM